MSDQDVVDRLLQIESLLRQVEQRIPDLEGLAVVTKDGLPIASALNTRVDEDRISAMTAAMLSLAERVVEELERGQMIEMIIKGSSGLIIIREELIKHKSDFGEIALQELDRSIDYYQK